MNKKAVINFHFIIALCILLTIIILSSRQFAQRAELEHRPFATTAAGVLRIGVEGEKANYYLEEAGKLAAQQTPDHLNEQGGCVKDYEGRDYICGSFMNNCSWYNNTHSCIPDLQENAKTIFSALHASLLYQHPYYRYPTISYAYEQQEDHLSVTGIPDEDFSLAFKAGGKKSFTMPERKGLQPDQENAIFTSLLPKKTRSNTKVDKIVVHATFSLTRLEAYSRLLTTGHSYHYIIAKDGTLSFNNNKYLFQHVPERDAAIHATCNPLTDECVPNTIDKESIAIAFVNCGDDESCHFGNCQEIEGSCWDNFTDEQLNAFVTLVQGITRRHPELLQNDLLPETAIITHNDLDTERTDPGPLFDQEKTLLLAKINDALQQKVKGSATATEHADVQTAPIETGGMLIGPTELCDGTEMLPEDYVERIDYEAWKSNGKSYYDLALETGIEKGVDPALLVAHMIHESSMGEANSCTKQGVSALTGCTWVLSSQGGCSANCGCDNEDTISDKAQLLCTANVDNIAYTQAKQGKGSGSYLKCNEYADDPEQMWTCMLCVYQGNYDKRLPGTEDVYFTRDGTCTYAEWVKDTYCSWRAFFESRGDLIDYELTKGSSRGTYSTPLSFTEEIPINTTHMDSLMSFTNNVIKDCHDNTENCIQEHLTNTNLKEQCGEPVLLEFMRKLSGCVAMQENIPCQFKVNDVLINDDFSLLFDNPGVWLVQSGKEAPKTLLLEGDFTNLITAEDNTEKHRYSLQFYEDSKETKVRLFIDGKKETSKKSLNESTFTFINKEGQTLFMQQEPAETKPPVITSRVFCDDLKNTPSFSLTIKDNVPPITTNLKGQYNTTKLRYEVQWEPVTHYPDGKPVTDIKAYKIYCSPEPLEQQTLLSEEHESLTITRKDDGFFEPEVYEQEGIMSAPIEHCGTALGLTSLGLPNWVSIVVAAEDAAGQINYSFKPLELSQLEISGLTNERFHNELKNEQLTPLPIKPYGSLSSLLNIPSVPLLP